MRTVETNLDLDRLKNDCRRIYNKVGKQYTPADVPLNKKYEEQNTQLSSAPQSSHYHDLYNVFLFPYDGIHELYEKICLAFWDINDNYEEPYYVHAWLNYQNKGQSIPWHQHWKALSGLDKTFVATFYVNAEPSTVTHEYANGHTIVRENKNNTIVIYEDTNDRHMVSTWEQDEPRITISMDIVPMKYIQGMPYVLNTWMPIL
jgi:hypothetical protein